MKRWVTYLKERSPIVPLLAIAAGVVESARVLSGASVGAFVQAIWILYYLLFLIFLRMMDEIKDFKKDQIVHPGRPLPRGLIRVEEMRVAMLVFGLALTAFAVVLGFTSSTEAGALALFSIIYAYLMYKEFFVGEKLARWPLTYAVTHQALCIPLYSSVFFAFSPAWSTSWGLYLAYSIGAGFAYEIGRKMDPKAHPVLGTYRHVSGDALTFVFFYFLLAVCAWAAARAGLGPLLFPFQALCALSGILVLLGKPKAHKIAEGFTILSASVQLWAPLLGRLLSSARLWGGP